MTKQKSSRKRYSQEYKHEVLALAEKSGAKSAAKEPGLHESQIYGWRVKVKAVKNQSDTERDQAAEIARLKRKRQIQPSPRQQRRKQMDVAVKEAFEARKGRSGSPGLTLDLADAGQEYDRKTLAASMRRQELRTKAAPMQGGTLQPKPQLLDDRGIDTTPLKNSLDFWIRVHAGEFRGPMVTKQAPRIFF